MLLSSRTTRTLLEAAEAAGVSRAEILAPLGLREATLFRDDGKVEWSTVVSLVERVSELVGGDVERLRTIGRRMGGTPSYEPVRRVARSVMSIRLFYEIASRVLAPAMFPHVTFTLEHLPGRLLRGHGRIVETEAGCPAFFHIFAGAMAQLPQLVGLPLATIVESRVTPRTIDLVLELPRSRSIPERVRRRVTALLGSRGALTVLERRRRELTASVDALQRARDELRQLLDRVPDLVVVHVSGTIVWANRAFVRALGFERMEDVAHTPLLALVDEHAKEVVREWMCRPVETTGDRALRDLVLKSRTGESVIIEVAPTQAVVFDGLPARLVLGRDITERVRMQQKLVVADRLASVGLLAAGVAHEVNNPLAYVLNNVEISRKELTGIGADAEIARRSLSVALDGVDRIRAIVRDLLSLSRGDYRSSDAVDVRAVAASTLALAARDIERTARLVQDFGPVPLVAASESRIALVLLNLVSNALDAMRGRPREAHELRVTIRRSPDGRVALEVSDTGDGLSAADLPRVFEPMFTTEHTGHGTGLGLAIAQRLVLDVGGEILVESEVGRGTTFRVLVPVAGSASEPRAPVASGEPDYAT